MMEALAKTLKLPRRAEVGGQQRGFLAGIYVEVAEGITGRGHCRLRDLVPDAAGALLGALVLVSMRKLRAFAKD